MLLTKNRLAVIFIHAGDMGDTDLFGTGGFAFVGIGAIAKALFVHLPHHIKHPYLFLRDSLRQMA